MDVQHAPFVSQPAQRIDLGLPRSTKAEVTAAHPVEVIEKNHSKSELERKYFAQARIYGPHMPMRMQHEANVLSRFGRMPGLPSSNLGLETLMGNDESITFADYLERPDESDVAVDFRGMVEGNLGLTVKHTDV